VHCSPSAQITSGITPARAPPGRRPADELSFIPDARRGEAYTAGMKTRIRRRVRALQAYAGGATLALILLASMGFAQSNASPRMEELTVQRINIVDANGTLRMVLSNKDRMHPGVMDGITIDRPRPVAGMLFFNDVGDEVGGLTFTGREVNGRGTASGGLMFDQWKQDQTIGIQYSESQGQRSAGLQVWDRSETQRLSELIEALNAANKLQDEAARAAAIAAARAKAQPGQQRLFVGKDRARASTVSLSDANGKARLVLKVEADGSASIEFLDADGKITSRLPSTRQ
jgi:hypothetical protein